MLLKVRTTIPIVNGRVIASKMPYINILKNERDLGTAIHEIDHVARKHAQR